MTILSGCCLSAALMDCRRWAHGLKRATYIAGHGTPMTERLLKRSTIITQHRDRGLLKSYRVHRGPEAPVSTDHRLLIATIDLQVPFVRSRRTVPRRVDVDRLRVDTALSTRRSEERRVGK